jgi:chitin disaccharide deacetylase
LSGRYLIVNADDFGRSPGVNRGVARTHEEGIVTSASLMVRWPAAAEAAAYAREHPELSVGLHLDLGEWAYADGRWDQVYEVGGDVEHEVPAQLERFRALVRREPTHVDSHQHVHRDEPLLGVAKELTQRLGVPLRDFSDVQYRGDFYGQTPHGAPVVEAISAEALVAILRTLPEGVAELGCHPADPPDLDSTYRDERLTEVGALCDPRVREALAAADVELISFAEV